ncbi:hypothetical protein MTR_8g461080 [Medicago truncatula]|uniref:Uncharacterized protein n=1 Tax=Medicago truncatula TaxID=3880 RepID=A0A072TRL7_MEDTR|nr:hypothetical protein MTR_8g461080 [Medicago truncatula]
MKNKKKYPLQCHNQKSFSRQTESIGKLTQLSTTFMFTPKDNSKQKRVKKTQEHETGHAVRELLAPASTFTRYGEL